MLSGETILILKLTDHTEHLTSYTNTLQLIDC